MKTINLRGITESLSESEMKKVVGGKDVPIVLPDDTTLTPMQVLCKDKVPWAACKYLLSGGDVPGQCVYRGNTLECVMA